MKTINGPDFTNLPSAFVLTTIKNLRHHDLELKNKTFEDCRLEKFYLPSVLLENCAFLNSVFEKVDMEEGVISSTSFSNCLLTDLKAPYAHFEAVSFYRSDLRGADFKNASFEGCFFEGTDLSAVDFSGADLSAINLYGCHSLVGAIFDHQTKLPFSYEEAKALGMTPKESPLKLIGSMDQPKKDLAHVEAPMSNVIDLNAYRSKKKKA